MVIAILGLAALLRLPYLADRPMHADEAMQADRFGTLLEKHSVEYDPAEHHGPALAYFTLPAAWLSRQWRFADLNEWTIRVIPALAGLVLVLVSFVIGNKAGRGCGLVAAIFTAVSPILVYYSRYYIPEMLLALFSAGLMLCLAAYQKSPGVRWALSAGVCAGLMFATKETAVLVFVAAAAGCLAARFRIRPADLGILLAAGLAVAALLLRSHSGEALHSLLIYAARGGSGGRHAHPWHYYLTTLAAGGDIFVLVIAAIAFARPGKRQPIAIFLGTYAAVLTVLYSAVQYKTPWCGVGIGHAWILATAAAFSGMLGGRWYRPAAALSAIVLAWMAIEAVRYSFPLAADPRNPYAYAHTTRDVYEIRDRIQAVALAQSSGYATEIDIFAAENWWPLPWYLRRFSQTRWWSAPPRQGRAGPLVLCSPSNEDAVARLLYEAPPPGQRELFVNLFSRPMWLRPGVEVRGYVAASAAPR